MELFENIRFVNIIEFLGTCAFAMSGIRLASAKKFDFFGAFVIGLVTAIGGGTTRDLLIGATPFWIQTPVYLIATFIALLIVAVFHKQLVRLNNTFFIWDCIGLGLFVVVGVEKTLAFGFQPWVAITMGVITGSVGGMLRDVLINEIPLVFRKEIYALACVIGGVVFTILYTLQMNPIANQVITAGVVILIRILAVKFQWHLPVLKGENQ
jgi:uncharacterized membrane protein YeiH